MSGALSVVKTPWTPIWTEALAAVTLAGSIRSRTKIPELALFPTFRIHVSAFTAGSVTASLRFGFADADSDVCTLGIDFPAAAALDASFYRSQLWDIAATVAPGTVGNPLSILPPNVSIIITTAAATTLTYTIYGTWLQAV